jgi:pyrroline-5-carboxylate reductase
MKISFIGGGNMASALIGGLLARDFRIADLHAVEPFAESRGKLAETFGIAVSEMADDRLAEADVLVLAVKPQSLRAAARQIVPHLGNQLVLSIAAGIRTTDISRWLGGDGGHYGRIVRSMPNTPALVGAGVTGLYAAPDVSAEQRAQAGQIMSAVGITSWFEQEEMLDAVTAVSGSGPAYVFYFIEALQQAAQEMGFTPEQAREFSVQTFVGAAKLAAESEEPASVLRERVTSKGGTTERALEMMLAAKVKESIIEAAKSASERSKELGDELGKG